jgi:hypothetical protein
MVKLTTWATAGILALPTVGSAAPLVHMWLVGRVVGTSDAFSATVAVLPGQSVEYQVWGAMARIGTSNTQINPWGNPVTRTIQSLKFDTLDEDADGINALKFDIFQDPNDPIQISLHPAILNPDPTPQPNDSWASGIGAQGTGQSRPGTNGYQDLIGVRPVHVAGVWTAVYPEIILSGVFDVPEGDVGPTSLVRMRWNGPGGARVNGNINGTLAISNTSETGPDPFVGFTPLAPATDTLVSMADSVVPNSFLALVLAPEPSSALTLAIGAGAMLSRKRR